MIEILITLSLIFIIVFLLVTFTLALSNYLVYGKHVDKKTKELVMSYDETDLYINPYSSKILMSYDKTKPSIYPVYLSIFSKYNVVGHGMVWRFSKLSKKIDYYYSVVKPYDAKKTLKK